MDLYSENILDHFKHPQNFGTLENPTKTIVEYNTLCGDKIRLDLIINEDQKISNIAFSGNGCAISQAAMSMLSEKLVGKSAKEAGEISDQEIYEMLGIQISPARAKCALLGLTAIRKAFSINSED